MITDLHRRAGGGRGRRNPALRRDRAAEDQGAGEHNQRRRDHMRGIDPDKPEDSQHDAGQAGGNVDHESAAEFDPAPGCGDCRPARTELP